jgi:hypothetical protein
MMTPKERAAELITKFIEPKDLKCADRAKVRALICINEMINNEFFGSHNQTTLAKIKTEIENYK